MDQRSAQVAGVEGGVGWNLISTVVEKSMLPDLVWVAQLRVSGNSSCCNIVNVHKKLSHLYIFKTTATTLVRPPRPPGRILWNGIGYYCRVTELTR
jgi:hypothetical protein